MERDITVGGKRDSARSLREEAQAIRPQGPEQQLESRSLCFEAITGDEDVIRRMTRLLSQSHRCDGHLRVRVQSPDLLCFGTHMREMIVSRRHSDPLPQVVELFPPSARKPTEPVDYDSLLPGYDSSFSLHSSCPSCSRTVRTSAPPVSSGLSASSSHHIAPPNPS